jgi:outer membrane protein assembly factor BamB
LRDGTIAWTANLPRSSCERPAVVRQVVVVACEEWVVAVDALTGHELWRKPIVTWSARGELERRAIAPPTATAGLVFVQDVEQGISAIEPRSGRVVWSHDLAGTSSEPAAASNGIVYVPSGTAGPPSGMLWDTVVQAIDARTGTVRWTAPTKGDILSSPVLDAGRVFVSTESGGPSFAIDARTGEIVHRFPRYGLQFPAAAGRLLVVGVGVGDGHQRVAAIEASTGDRVWAMRTPNGFTIQPPTVIAGTAYIASNQGGDLLYAVVLATGTREWEFHLNDATWTAAGPGDQLLVTTGHALIAYRLS